MILMMGFALGGTWQTQEWVDPMTDKPGALVSLSSEDVGAFGKQVDIVVRCRGGRLDAYLSNIGILEGRYDNGFNGRVRFDSHKPKKFIAASGQDQVTWFITYRRDQVLAGLTSSARMVIEVSPYGSNPLHLVFNVPGDATPLASVLERCGQRSKAGKMKTGPEPEAIQGPLTRVAPELASERVAWRRAHLERVKALLGTAPSDDLVRDLRELGIGANDPETLRVLGPLWWEK